MIDLDFEFTAPLWEYSGKGSWHFVTLPQDISADIKTFTRHLTKGFRTVRVSVSVGDSQWKTSIFPDSKLGAYVLPIKAAIRKAEGLKHGDSVSVKLAVGI